MTEEETWPDFEEKKTDLEWDCPEYYIPRKKVMTKRCAGCGDLYESKSVRSKYCGSRNDKWGCSYMNRTKSTKNKQPKPAELIKDIPDIPNYANETVTKGKLT